MRASDDALAAFGSADGAEGQKGERVNTWVEESETGCIIMTVMMW